MDVAIEKTIFAKKKLLKMKRLQTESLSVLFILTTIIFSCSPTQDDQEFYELDGLINKNPQQGLITVDSILLHQKEMDLHREMELSLLKYKAEDKCFIDHQSDITITALFNYFDRLGNNYQKILSYYYMGGTYRDMGDYPLSIVWYDKAEEYAMSCPLTKRDSILLTSILGQEAEINYRTGRNDEAFRKLRKSFSLQCELGIDDFWTYQDMGRMASLCDSVDFASKCYQRSALEMFSHDFENIRLSFIGEQLGFYVDIGNSKMADMMANAILSLDTLPKPVNVYSSMGKYYDMMKDDKQMALDYYLMAYNMETNLGRKAQLSKRISVLDYKIDRKDEALVFAQRFFAEADSFDVMTKAMETKAAQVQRHVEEIEASRAFKKETAFKNNIKIAVFIAVVALLLVIILSILYINNRRNLKLMKDMQRVKEERDRVSEQHTQLTIEVEHDKRLRAESAQDVATVITKLKEIADSSKGLHEDYWETVFNTVDSIYPDFRSRLLCFNSELQNKDLIILYMMKLGFKQADIARITKKARSVISRKIQRIELLLGVPLSEAIKEDNKS